MKNPKTHFFAATGLALIFTTPFAFGYASGPDPRYTGAPGDQTCAVSGCHVGTGVNAGGGGITITFPSGNTYTPGQQQTLTIKVTDPKFSFAGFQMSARLASNPANGQAGDFMASGGQLVLCDDGSPKSSKGCAPNVSVQFIEHNVPSTTGVWQVLWTPPPTNVGNVMIYVAGNTNTQQSIPAGSHIYTENYTLTPATSGGRKPSVSQAGIVSASAFNPMAGLTSGTWLEIFGSDISTTTRGWGGGDFSGSQGPTTLDGVKVTINGKNAFVDFISPGQVNVQAPDDSATGPVQIIVTNSNGSSDAVTVDKSTLAPALLAPGPWNVGGKQYVVAQFTDGTYVGAANLINGLKFRPAKAGDIVTIYGIGFGPVTPNTPAGTVAAGITALQNKANFLFGQTAGDLSCNGCYAGLAPGAVGLYQFNVKVPNGPTGDVALVVDAGGVSTKQTLFITVQ